MVMFPCSPLPRFLLGISVVLSAFSPIHASEEGAAFSGTPLTIRIEAEDRAELRALSRLVSIVDVQGNDVRAVAIPGDPAVGCSAIKAGAPFGEPEAGAGVSAVRSPPLNHDVSRLVEYPSGLNRSGM